MSPFLECVIYNIVFIVMIRLEKIIRKSKKLIITKNSKIINFLEILREFFKEFYLIKYNNQKTE